MRVAAGVGRRCSHPCREAIAPEPELDARYVPPAVLRRAMAKSAIVSRAVKRDISRGDDPPFPPMSALARGRVVAMGSWRTARSTLPFCLIR